MILIGIPTLILIYIAFSQAKYWFLLIIAAVFLKGLGGQTSYLCWFAWMGEIAPKKLQNYFFGTRNFFGQIGRIIGFVVAFFVLKLNYPTLILLGFLYIASYIFYNLGETSMYFFHPDSKRKLIKKNQIFNRMKKTFKNKIFVNFLLWFIILKGVLIVNILYLEYYLIKILQLSYLWIPLSFILLAISSAIAFYILRNLFQTISYRKKRFMISTLVLLSSLIWLFSISTPFLILSLFFAGFSLGALTLSEKVDLINNSSKKDKEADYAVFRFISPLFITILISILSIFQQIKFNFIYTFYITVPLTLISFIFLKTKQKSKIKNKDIKNSHLTENQF